MHKALLFFWSYMRSRELQLREREIVFLVVHEISDDYHPIAGPPEETFEISLYVKSRFYFGALRQISVGILSLCTSDWLLRHFAKKLALRLISVEFGSATSYLRSERSLLR